MNDVRITITEFRHVIFDKRELKAALRSGAKIILSEARRLISTKAVSGDGGIPGLNSGIMKKSLKINVGSGGGYARVMPYMTPAMRTATTSRKYPNGAFYPAFLMVGTRRGLKPRKDFMQLSLDNRQIEIRAAIRQSLQNALRAI